MWLKLKFSADLLFLIYVTVWYATTASLWVLCMSHQERSRPGHTRDDISQNAWKYLKITQEELEETAGEKGLYQGLFGLYHMAAILLLCHAHSGKLKCCYQKENVEFRKSDK